MTTYIFCKRNESGKGYEIISDPHNVTREEANKMAERLSQSAAGRETFIFQCVAVARHPHPIPIELIEHDKVSC